MTSKGPGSREQAMLCRLVRGKPPIPSPVDLAALERLGHIEMMGARECDEAQHYARILQEGELLREALAQNATPRGVATLFPKVRNHARARIAELQQQLDDLSGERSRIESSYPPITRQRWSMLPYAASTPDGSRIIITIAGYCAAADFYLGAGAVPAEEVLARDLAEAANRCMSVAAAIGEWQRIPDAIAWIAAAILCQDQACCDKMDALHKVYLWFYDQDLWGQDPFPLAVILGSAPAGPIEATRDAMQFYQALHTRGFENSLETLSVACQLAARPTWMTAEDRVKNMAYFRKRAVVMQVLDSSRFLPWLPLLATLPRLGSDSCNALRTYYEPLHHRYPSASYAIDMAALLLTGVGLFHPQQHGGDTIMSRMDPAVDAFLERYSTLRELFHTCGKYQIENSDRVTILAATASFLPGDTESIAKVLDAADNALAAVGAPASICRLPAAIALAGVCYGKALGGDPAELTWALLRNVTIPMHIG